MRSAIEILQPLGRALMLPIAVLPIAGLLLRLGQPDLLDIAVLSAAGGAIFDNLGMLFAIGVATGYARDGNGAACLAGIVCFLVATRGAQSLLTVPPVTVAGLAAPTIDLAAAAWRQKAIAKLDVPIGIVSGLVGGHFYNRFSTMKLPEYLAFFAGRRFVPIVSGLAGLAIAVMVGLGYGVLSSGIDAASFALAGAGPVGLFVFGMLNRLLLVTGLHHLLNNIVWFVLGDYHGTNGDLRRFFAGDPTAGAFMTGFFPVMMFGLPAACLAMYHKARPDRRKAVGGMLLSLALTSFLTGVTEPIEFSFMFLAPVLYAVHAVLTGLAMVLMDLLHVRIGFGFSAGLFDYVLNFGKAARPLLLLPVGALYAIIYYALFRVVITRLDLPTPGRERTSMPDAAPVAASERGRAFVDALGGSANLTSVGACTTRLRLVVVDRAAVDTARLQALGSRGILTPSANAMQIVLGPVADQVAVEMRDALAAGIVAVSPIATLAPTTFVLPAPFAAALGGSANVIAAGIHAGRLRVDLRDLDAIDAASLTTLGVRGITPTGGGILHILLPASAIAGFDAG